MKVTTLAVGAACATAANAAAVEIPHAPQLVQRAAPANPSGYAPQRTSCPSNRPALREAGSLSSQESNWLQTRRNMTVQPMSDFLSRVNISGFDAQSYINAHRNNVSMLPNIGIALSGGGYRAQLNGAGVVEAFDSRTPGSNSSGQLGGVLQSATYLSGLSGGNWAVGSLYSNNFSSVYDIVYQPTGDLWNLEQPIFTGPNQDDTVFGTVDYWHNLLNDVNDKKNAGFNVSITDYWGRALSYQLVNATDGGPGYTWSSIASQDWFTSGTAPMPILITDNRAPGQVLIPDNTTILEINPWEMGSWDPTIYGFAPTQYVGSNFNAGTLADNESCVIGFDNVGYCMGTSSSLFNEALIELNSSSASGVPSFIRNALESILKDIGEDENDIADWSPNPFYNYNPSTNPTANSTRLTLVDGGEDGQNIPLHPLIQPVRDVDVIFAVDSSADTTTSWPNGTSMVATYERSLNNTIDNGTSFPYVPGQQSFVNLGLNNRPTFFGCNASNYTNPSVAGPLIVYLPNSYYSTQSNVSTFDLKYNRTFEDAILQNGYNGATQGNGTLDSQWPVCVACAMLQRSLMRTNTAFPSECNTCFSRYCWNGQTNDTTNLNYNPSPKLQTVNVSQSSGGDSKNAAAAYKPSLGTVGAAVSLAGLLALA